MRTPRQHKIDRAVAEALAMVGSYLLPHEMLVGDASRQVIPRPLRTEVEESIHYQEREGRIAGAPTETGAKWKLTDLGRLWLAENA